MRMRLLCVLLALFLMLGCRSTQETLLSGYGSTRKFLFPQVEPAAASAKLQWHLREYRYSRGIQTNQASRDHAKGR